MKKDLKKQKSALKSWYLYRKNTVPKYGLRICKKCRTRYFVERKECPKGHKTYSTWDTKLRWESKPGSPPNPEKPLKELPSSLLFPYFPTKKSNQGKQSSDVWEQFFDENNEENDRIGKEGELLVLEDQRQKLEKKGRYDLSKKVKLTENRFANHDIDSFNVDGSKKFIEVKSTTENTGNTPFFMSKGEYEFAEKNKGKYVIARVWNVFKNPEVIYIENPLDKLYFETKKYLVFLRLGKK